MHRGKKVSKGREFFTEQSGIVCIDGFKNDPVKGSTGAILHHQQAVERIVASQNFGNVVIFAQIRAESLDVFVFTVKPPLSQFPVGVAFRVKELPHHAL